MNNPVRLTMGKRCWLLDVGQKRDGVDYESKPWAQSSPLSMGLVSDVLL
jgi:hypothetical protein